MKRAVKAPTTHTHDYITAYVNDLKNVVKMDAVKAAGLKLGADALGRFGPCFLAGNCRCLRPQYRHHEQSCRPDILIHDRRQGRKDTHGTAPRPMLWRVLSATRTNTTWRSENDPDFDRHGIVTKSAGLLNPNHYLAVAINYLFANRPGWKKEAAVGKTLVSSSMIDRVSIRLGRKTE